MKLENEIPAPRDGVLREVAVRAGQPVEKDQLLFVVE
jgi:biotin carboxyl carrier protein